MCYKNACSDTFSSLDVRMWKIIFFTGVGSLMLGVFQNLPKAEVLEVNYPMQIQMEYDCMEKRLNGEPCTGLVTNN